MLKSFLRSLKFKMKSFGDNGRNAGGLQGETIDAWRIKEFKKRLWNL